MKRFIVPFVVSAIVVSAAGTSAHSQNRVTVTTEKVNIKGEIMYAHTVRKGETLFSIGKAYDVTLDALRERNPQIASGLKAGMILYIPIRKEPGNDTGRKESGTVRQQEVQEQRETPVPAPKTEKSSRERKKENSRYKRHTVRWYESMKDIAAFYEIPEEAIMSLNGLKNNKLQKRQILLIPDKQYLSDFYAGETQMNRDKDSRTETVPDAEKKGIDKSALFPESGQKNNGTDSGKQTGQDRNTVRNDSSRHGFAFGKEEPVPFGNESIYGTIKAGLILPLNSKDTALLNTEFLDFYAGSLLALQDLKEEGIATETEIFDQNSNTDPAGTLLGEPGKFHLLIGPVMSRDLEKILPVAGAQKIPVVSPMDPAAEALSSEWLLQAPPSVETQLANLVGLLKEQFKRSGSDRVLLITEKDGMDRELAGRAEQLLQQENIPYNTISYGILEGRQIYQTLANAFTDSLRRAVLVPSNNEAFVSDVVRNLGLIEQNGHPIELFGLPKWHNFEIIDVSLFHRLNLHLSLPYYVDYDNEDVQRFLLRYRALYRTEPTPYAFQGYDLVRYMLRSIRRSGNNFPALDRLPEGRMLQTDFLFYKKDGLLQSGFENRATRNIRYNPDYSITLLPAQNAEFPERQIPEKTGDDWFRSFFEE